MRIATSSIGLFATLLAGGVGSAEEAGGDASCLECHAEEGSTLEFDDGESISVQVKPETIANSVHKQKLLCTDCHRRNTEYPHPDVAKKSHRDYTLAQYELCRRCHFANYTRTLESVHYKLLTENNRKTPVCVDCHGAHDVKPAARPRADISRKCAHCHEKVFSTYAASVHGKALLDHQNEDVPVCTDCHRAHDIADPRGPKFALQIPALCGRCHADEATMRKYGLSTAVVKTYLSDFHGVTARMYRESGKPTGVVAVCTDCHGVHDIGTTRGADSGQIKAKLAAACSKCHKNVGSNFPDAWLKHYEPSLEKAPLVYAVKVFYWIFIPLVIGGLLLQIFLHIWRIAVNR